MLDIKFVRENPDAVKENIKKKFQDEKLPLVDEVIELDSQRRANIQEADQLRSDRNRLSKQVGMLMGQAKKDPSKLEEAEAIKAKVKAQAERLAELEKLEVEYEEKLHQDMLQIPNIIDPSVPIGPDDSHNVEVQRFGEPVVPDYPIPYHVDIMESFDGIDLDVVLFQLRQKLGAVAEHGVDIIALCQVLPFGVKPVLVKVDAIETAAYASHLGVRRQACAAGGSGYGRLRSGGLFGRGGLPDGSLLSGGRGGVFCRHGSLSLGRRLRSRTGNRRGGGLGSGRGIRPSGGAPFGAVLS